VEWAERCLCASTIVRIVIKFKANTVSGRYESDYELRTKLEDWGSCLHIDSASRTLNCKGSEKAAVPFLYFKFHKRKTDVSERNLDKSMTTFTVFSILGVRWGSWHWFKGPNMYVEVWIRQTASIYFHQTACDVLGLNGKCSALDRFPFRLHTLNRTFANSQWPEYTECFRRNLVYFVRTFLWLNYAGIAKGAYIRIWTVAEIMTRWIWWVFVRESSMIWRE
jgi:hypothetical protein